MKGRISSATTQGPRAEQQDRYLSSRCGPGQLLAVMDGHGGSETAELLVSKIKNVFELVLKDQPGAIEADIRKTFQNLADLTQKEASGSTLSLVYVPDDESAAYVGIVGDSPVIILDAEGHWQTSPLHNARSNPRERDAALDKGARYAGGYLEDPQVPGYGLQLSRALGDTHLDRILNREPEIYQVPLGKTSLIVLATDGVLDSLDVYVTDQLTRLATLAQSVSDARALVQDALQRETGDNVTVILWKAD